MTSTGVPTGAGRKVEQRWSSLLGGHGLPIRALYADSFWLILVQVANYGLGFVFWLTLAHFYTPVEVGTNAAVLTVAPLLALLGTMGLGYSLIGYLGASEIRMDELLNAAITLIAIVTSVLTAFFVVGAGTWLPALAFLRHQPEYFVTFVILVVSSALYSVLTQAFVAAQWTGFSAVISLIFGGVKLLAAATLGRMAGALGITLSWSLAATLAVLVGLGFGLPRAIPSYRFAPRLHFHHLRATATFSLANYVSDGCWLAPGWLLPLLVLSTLGPATNAVLVITWAIAMVPYTVPQAVSLAFFAAGARAPDGMAGNFRQAWRLTMVILVPLCLLTLAGSGRILSFYGAQYSSGSRLLTLMVIAMLPASLTSLYLGVARIQQRRRELVAIGAATAVSTFGLSAALLGPMGLTGVGVAFLVSQSGMALAVLPRLRRVLREARDNEIRRLPPRSRGQSSE